MHDKIRITFYTLYCIVGYATSNRIINQQCESQILKAFPDAVCHATLDTSSCNLSCKKQAEMKCGRGRPNQIEKLQCQKQRSMLELYSCCCRVDCKGRYQTYFN